MKATEHLKQLWLEDMQRKHPLMTAGQIGELSINGTPSNKLTKQIIKYIQLIGGRAERVRSEGRYKVGEQYTDVFGKKRQTNGYFIPSTSRKGTADVSALVKGKSLAIEIKIGADRMSDHQKKYKEETEQAGGYYIIAKDFQQAYDEINKIINQ